MSGRRAALHQRVEDNAFHRTTVTQLPRRDDQPRPACKETKATERSNSTEPSQVCQRHNVKASAEKKDPCKKQPPRAAIRCAVKRKREQRDRVNEVIENRLVPHILHAARFECRPQGMCAKRSQCHCQETKRSSNSNKQNQHAVISSDSDVSPTAFLDHSRLLVGFRESFSNRKLFQPLQGLLPRKSSAPVRLSRDTRQELRRC